MNKIRRLITITFISSLLSVPLAEATPFYLSFNAGISKLSDFCTTAAAGVSCKDIAAAGTLDLGFQASDMIAIELGYGNYGKPTRGDTGSQDTAELSGSRLMGVVNIPISKTFAFTGKLGVSRANLRFNQATSSISTYSYSADSTSLAYGIGIKYTIDRYLSLRAQYENLGKIGDDTIGTDTLSLLTIGITYNLGKPRAHTSTAEPVLRGQQAAAVQSAVLPPMRVIVFLEREPAEDKQQLTAAVAQACQCQPSFVRMHTSSAVIYQVNLAPGQTFLTFKSALIPGDASLGMKGLMQSQ